MLQPVHSQSHQVPYLTCMSFTGYSPKRVLIRRRCTRLQMQSDADSSERWLFWRMITGRLMVLACPNLPDHLMRPPTQTAQSAAPIQRPTADADSHACHIADAIILVLHNQMQVSRQRRQIIANKRMYGLKKNIYGCIAPSAHLKVVHQCPVHEPAHIIPISDCMLQLRTQSTFWLDAVFFLQSCQPEGYASKHDDMDSLASLCNALGKALEGCFG
jgi:hypothetical protein